MSRFSSYATSGLAALAGGCAMSADPGPSPAAESELARALDGRVAGAPVSCVRLADLGGNRSAGDAIIFDGHGSRLYLNRPSGGCPSLAFGRALRVRSSTGQLCRGDIVAVFDPTTGTDYGGCGLGDFIPYERVG